MSDIAKTAEQAIHDILWKKLSEMVEGNVHESRPMNDVGYPFADFEDSDTGFTGTKNGTLSRVTINLNVWDKEDNRKNVSNICALLFTYAIAIRDAYGYKVSLRVNDSGIRITQDRTVSPPIWRGMINLVFDIL